MSRDGERKYIKLAFYYYGNDAKYNTEIQDAAITDKLSNVWRGPFCIGSQFMM